MRLKEREVVGARYGEIEGEEVLGARHCKSEREGDCRCEIL